MVTTNTINTLSIMVTYQCNIECKHCGPYCSSKEKDWMSVEEIKRLIVEAEALGAYNVVFTGGEPTLLKNNLNHLLEFIKNETSILSTRIVSNAKWAKTYDIAYAFLLNLKNSGLDELNVSCGEFHQEFVSIERIANAYKAGVDVGFDTVLFAGEFLKEGRGKYSIADFENAGLPILNTQLKSPFLEKTHGFSCGIAHPYGRGKEYINREDIPLFELENIASACSDLIKVITAHPNGKVTACCGIMTRDESLLDIGNWRNKPLSEIVQDANDDLVLNWIRHLGLKDMKKWLESKDPSICFPRKYASNCDLCATILNDKTCQKLLQEESAEKIEEVMLNKIVQDSTIYARG